jgi:MFS family permease
VSSTHNAAPSPSRDGWYTLAVLIVAYVLAFVDRQILGLLVEPIKHDLQISDTRISLLQGFSFAIFLALSGLVMGRLVDKTRRVTVVAVGIAAWSVMTAGCSLASTFTQLFLCRMGVGIGEATLTPAAHSIVADRFSGPRLGLALGIFGIGSYLGSGLALLLSAFVIAHLPKTGLVEIPWLGGLHPWQVVFLVVGLPGLLVSAWVSRLREPERRSSHVIPSLAQVSHYFRQNLGSILLVNLMGAFCAMAVYGSSAWIPTHLIRTFGWTASKAGISYGVLISICGTIGVIVGGSLSDFAVSRGIAGGRPLVMALASLCAAPFAAMTPLVDSPGASLALVVPFTVLITISLGTLPAAQQAMTPPRMRGLAAVFGVFVVNLIGLGLGPTVVAVITDRVFQDPAKLRYSLAVVLPIALLISALCGLGSLRFYRASVTRLSCAESAAH